MTGSYKIIGFQKVFQVLRKWLDSQWVVVVAFEIGDQLPDLGSFLKDRVIELLEGLPPTIPLAEVGGAGQAGMETARSQEGHLAYLRGVCGWGSDRSIQPIVKLSDVSPVWIDLRSVRVLKKGHSGLYGRFGF